jgi:hypothetical protein
MAERKSFLLRIDGEVLEGVRRWADGDLRSLNGQIEFLLRKALAEAGRRGHSGAASGEGLSTTKDSHEEPESKA